MKPEKEFLTTTEISNLFRVSKSTVGRWRRAGIGPPAITVGRRALYPIFEFQAWQKDQLVSTTRLRLTHPSRRAMRRRRAR